jgi:hypothetical protein
MPIERQVECLGIRRLKVFIIGGVSVSEEDREYRAQLTLLGSSMTTLGRCIVEAGHDLLVCSPFPAAADAEAVRGAADALRRRKGALIEFHYPREQNVERELDKLLLSVPPETVRRYFYPTIVDGACNIQWTYSWLTAQLSALDRCQAVIALGGKPSGSASLLLAVAESRRRYVAPMSYLGGAAALAFERRRYELQDRLGACVTVLQEAERVERVISLIESLASEQLAASAQLSQSRFFISYPRSRPKEADFVEITLRRRNWAAYRDERDFEAGQAIPSEIAEHICESNVFIVIWCKEYACSPWCYDEFDLALRRHEAGKIALWIFCVDDTRVVPPAARELLNYPSRTREELEGQLLKLLESLH